MSGNKLQGQRRRRPRLFAAAAVLSALIGGLGLAAATSIATAPAAEARAKIKCKETTGTAAVDPIVHHNAPVGTGMIHMHQFFGTNSLLSLPNPNAANYLDLLNGSTNCENQADTAGYWTPVLRYKATGQVVPTRAFTAYYRSWDRKQFGEGVPLPSDVRLVAHEYDWTCGRFRSVEPSQSIPDCSRASGTAGSTLTAHVDFPTCWDGVKPVHTRYEMGDTTDNEHFAYRDGNTCPAGFPVKTVMLRETIQFQYNGRGDDVELSSDMMMGTSDGQSMHADFWNTWDPAGFASMVRNCINPGGNRRSAECG